jgi:hypothetical protein
VTQTGVDTGMAKESAACCGVNLGGAQRRVAVLSQGVEYFAGGFQSAVAANASGRGLVLFDNRNMGVPQAVFPENVQVDLVYGTFGIG